MLQCNIILNAELQSKLQNDHMKWKRSIMSYKSVNPSSITILPPFAGLEAPEIFPVMVIYWTCMLSTKALGMAADFQIQKLNHLV